MKISTTNPFLRLSQEYLLQQGIEDFSKDNLLEFGLNEKDYFHVLLETESSWVTRYNAENDVINVIFKSPNYRMECIEL